MQLNCDLGESYGNWNMGHDAAVMPFIDQASIACGFHAGDPLTMRSTLALAARHGVAIGAPGPQSAYSRAPSRLRVWPRLFRRHKGDSPQFIAQREGAPTT